MRWPPIVGDGQAPRAPGSGAIDVAGVRRRFAGHLALDDISLTVREGEFFSLLGPSGCGKTTLLRILAGLDLPDAGTVRIGGADMRDVPAYRRPVNTVFQSYALFPHLTVRDNVSFGLRMKKLPGQEIDRRVARAMELVQIGPLAGRRPSEISGGQKQRVALARALINEPQVLLLDEPLGALDSKLRKELQVELAALQRSLGMTFVYVTHDQEEALVMSDRIAVMRAGRIEQLDEARRLYEWPRTRFVGQFLGSCNIVEAVVGELSTPGARVESAFGPLTVGEGTFDRAPGSRVTLAIRPEKIAMLPSSAPPGDNRIPVRIARLVYIGSETHYELESAGQSLTAYAMNAGGTGPELRPGDAAVAVLPPASLVVLED
ncbi:MAG: ABC transporter ATP-binding protein [Acidobacteriota bacterium]